MGWFNRKRPGAGKTVLITGASGGIGEAFTHLFARDGYDLILVARSAAELEKLGSTLAAQHGNKAEAVAHDLGEIGAGEALIRKLGAKANDVHILVNNAGFGLIGEFANLDLARQLNMIDLNVRVLTELAHALVPVMKGRKGGGLLNVASTAAFQPGPFMAVYYATKAYVRWFSEALNEELRGTGVHVMTLCPGPVATGFQARAEFTDETKLTRLVPVMTADEVARQGYNAFRAKRRTYIPGWVNWFMAQSVSFTPRWMILRLARYLQT